MDLKDYFVFTWGYDRGNPREAEITNEGEHLELRISREVTVSEEITIDRKTAQEMYDALGKWLAKQPAAESEESE